jgi:hypothetical protein
MVSSRPCRTFCFDGVIWLSGVPDPAGDHREVYLSAAHLEQSSNQLGDRDSSTATVKSTFIFSEYVRYSRNGFAFLY